jgi:hypothetical protein
VKFGASELIRINIFSLLQNSSASINCRLNNQKQRERTAALSNSSLKLSLW